jgi:hypothetical protein
MLHCGASAAAGQGEPRRSRARLLFVDRHRAGEGLDVGAANYKARLNLRVGLATAAKLRDGKPKGNEAGNGVLLLNLTLGRRKERAYVLAQVAH